MRVHKVKKESVSIAVKADAELQKAFNTVRRELHLPSNSSVIRVLVMEKSQNFLQKNTSRDVIV